MSIIPWLNYPGRPIKKKPYKMPYSPPYKGSPYEYINLPNPGNLPQAVWENIMKDFDQSFRVSYKEITSAKIVADETEFEQQPGAVGLAITLDPREYTGKSLKKVVWDDIAKRWFQSVISWSDLDVITEQQFIWRPLLRGDNGGKLGALLKPKKSEEPIEPNVPVRKVYEGMDKERFTQAWKSGPEGKWVDIDTKTPYEKLSTAIEEWSRYGRSRGDRLGRWGMARRAWLQAIASDVSLYAAVHDIKLVTPTPVTTPIPTPVLPVTHAPLYLGVNKFLGDYSEMEKLNTWIYVSSESWEGVKGVGVPDKSPFRLEAEQAGFDPGLDRPIFKYQLCEEISEKIFEKTRTHIPAQKLYAMSDAEISMVISTHADELKGAFGTSEEALKGAIPGSVQSLMSLGELEKAKDFYKKRMKLINGQLYTLETTLIGSPLVPLEVKQAAIRKHREISNWVQKKDIRVDELTADLHNRAREMRGILEELGANPALFDWQRVLQFRENVYLTQDFLEAAFEENTLFRVYVWLGKASAHLPEWMGNWKTRLTYITPAFYTGHLFSWLDEHVLGIASAGEKRLLFRRFDNAAYLPLANGKEVLFKASDFYLKDTRNFWSVHKKLEKLVDNKAVIDGIALTPDIRNSLFVDRAGDLTLDKLISSPSINVGTEMQAEIDNALSAIKKNLLKKEEVEQFRAFRDFIRSKYGSLVNVNDPEEFARFLDTAKGKLIKEEFKFAGPLVRVGRLLDHLQNAFVNKFIKPSPIFGKYAQLFKAGNIGLAKVWDESRLGKLLTSWSKGLIKVGGEGGKKGLAKILGSKVLAPFTKLFGSLLGAVGGIVVGLLVWLGTKLISDLWGLLRGNPVEATKKAVAQIGKLILGAVACCAAPIILLLFIVSFIIPGIFSQAARVGTALAVGAIFDRLEVNKNATFDQTARKVDYVLTIKNISADEQLVTLVGDTIRIITSDCTVPPVDPKSDASLGQVSYTDPPDGKVDRRAVKAGETITIKYSLINIPASLQSATILNTALLEIPPKLGFGISDTGTISNSIEIGSGGCISNLGPSAIAEVLALCLENVAANVQGWPFASSRRFNMTCVAKTGLLLRNTNCQSAFNAYYSGPPYHPDNLQCTAFANIVLGCYKGSGYYVSGNASSWLSTALGHGFDVYGGHRRAAPGIPPKLGSVLVFSGGYKGYGHVGIVTAVSNARGNVNITMASSNLSRVYYNLLFNSYGQLVGGDKLEGLEYLGFLYAQ